MKNRSSRLVVLLILMLSWAASGADQPRDLYSDTWVATDDLGRSLPTAKECGPPRPDKVVGIFYFLWMGSHGQQGPFDITQLLRENSAKPQYGPQGAFHHWGQPELGYYLSDSEYVIRKHISMLNDAGVDVLIFDVTNAVTYPEVYTRVFDVCRELRRSGHKTPLICFLTHSNSAATMKKLYDDVYLPGKYKELWFVWKGKPLLLGPPEGLGTKILDFFSIRDCWAWTGGKDYWNWVDHTPQRFGWHVSSDKPEECSVSTAEHATSNIGRSFHAGKQPQVNSDLLTGDTPKGLFFQEQWESALKLNPEFIFITGWNEWVAQRFINNGQTPFLGRPPKEGDTFFVDQYNQEFSRDIEPMKGGHTDNYYYQMIAGIRRYKGARPVQPGMSKTIQIDGNFDDWKGVLPEYRDTGQDTLPRDEAGWGNAGRYENKTGRNDFVTMKVTYDSQYVYFYAATREPVSSFADTDWMMVMVDQDQNPATGWNGYDLWVNSKPMTSSSTTVKRFEKGGWLTADKIIYKYAGNEMELRVPRSTIQPDAARPPAFDFHWVDNCQGLTDILNLSLYGDSAPNRRFNYRFAGQ